MSKQLGPRFEPRPPSLYFDHFDNVSYPVEISDYMLHKKFLFKKPSKNVWQYNLIKSNTHINSSFRR